MTAIHALVVCALPFGDDPSEEPVDHFTRAMRLARAGEMARTVFAARRDGRPARAAPGGDPRPARRPAGPAGASAAHAPRRRAEPERPAVRVWIEGLPGTDAGAGALLDELARG